MNLFSPIPSVLIVVLLIMAIILAVFFVQTATPPKLGITEAGQLQPLGIRPNAVSSQSDDPRRRVASWSTKSSLAQTKRALMQAVEQVANARLVTDDAGYLRFVVTTPLMKWRDDLEFLIDQNAGQVDIRSASRAGISDRGLNRSRLGRIAQVYALAESG